MVIDDEVEAHLETGLQLGWPQKGFRDRYFIDGIEVVVGGGYDGKDHQIGIELHTHRYLPRPGFKAAFFGEGPTVLEVVIVVARTLGGKSIQGDLEAVCPPQKIFGEGVIVYVIFSNQGEVQELFVSLAHEGK